MSSEYEHISDDEGIANRLYIIILTANTQQTGCLAAAAYMAHNSAFRLVFTARQSRVWYGRDVCPSVRPSQAGNVTKQPKIGLRGLHWRTLVFAWSYLLGNSNRFTPSDGVKWQWGMEKWRFWPLGAVSLKRCTIGPDWGCYWSLKPNTHRRRRRDETVLSRRVGVGGVYMNSRWLPTDSALQTHNAAVGRDPVHDCRRMCSHRRHDETVAN